METPELKLLDGVRVAELVDSDRDAGDRVYVVAPAVIAEIADRLTGAWGSISVRTRALGADEAEPVIAEILRSRRALPSQWLPALTVRRVADG